MIKAEGLVEEPVAANSYDLLVRCKAIFTPRVISVLVLLLGIALFSVALTHRHHTSVTALPTASQQSTGGLTVVPAQSSVSAPQAATAGLQSAQSISPTAANAPAVDDSGSIQTGSNTVEGSNPNLQSLADRSQDMSAPTLNYLQPTGSFSH